MSGASDAAPTTNALVLCSSSGTASAIVGEIPVRSAESVLAAASKRLGVPPTPDAWPGSQLEAAGVRWAWQLAHLSDADWDKLGVPLGLKAAAKAELMAEPTSVEHGAANDDAVGYEELPERVRRFLLLPEGSSVEPLGELSALFLALLTIPVAKRQQLLLELCKLIAIVSGLFIIAPLNLANPSSLDIDKERNPWRDSMDALAGATFLVNFHVAFFAIFMGMYVAANGGQADDGFCESVMSVMSIMTLFLMLGSIFPLTALCFWRFYTAAESPYPMLANVVVVMLLHHLLGGATQRFLVTSLPLELYHTPKWFLCMLRGASLGMGTTHLLAPAALKAAAERRAAHLRPRRVLPKRA